MFTSLYSRRNSIRAILSLKYVTSGSFRRETSEHSRTVHDIVKAVKFPTYSALGIRCFSATTDKVCLLDESEFHLIADETLEELVGYLDTLENSLDDLEVDLSNGVLNISLSSKDISWVINKQTPNRQIWWSSPLSGPRRYEWIGERRKGPGVQEQGRQESVLQWVSSRESPAATSDFQIGPRPNLFDTLREELLQVTGLDIRQ